MSDPTHFDGFHPAKAIQYDGENAAQVEALVGEPLAVNSKPGMSLMTRKGALVAVRGDWLVVRDDGVTTAQSQEPPRVLGEYRREREVFNPDTERTEFNGYDYYYELSNGALIPKVFEAFTPAAATTTGAQAS